MSEAELRDHAEDILVAVVHDMRLAQTGEEQSHKSQGHGSAHCMRGSRNLHADDRAVDGRRATENIDSRARSASIPGALGSAPGGGFSRRRGSDRIFGAHGPPVGAHRLYSEAVVIETLRGSNPARLVRGLVGARLLEAERRLDDAVAAHCPRRELRTNPRIGQRQVRTELVPPASRRAVPTAIGHMVTSPEYRPVPTGTLAILAQRLGTMSASPSTWYRLVRRDGWRRPRLRVPPAKPKTGLRTTRADEMWHIDTTVIRLRRHTRLSAGRDRQLLSTHSGVARGRDVRTGEISHQSRIRSQMRFMARMLHQALPVPHSSNNAFPGTRI